MDDIDSAFSDILSRVQNFARPSFETSDIFTPFLKEHFGQSDAEFGNRRPQDTRNLLDKIRNIVLKVTQILSDLQRIGLADDAAAIKQNIVDLAATVPWFDHMFLPRRPGSGAGSDGRKIEKRLEDLDSLVARYERKTAEYSSLSPAEKEKVRQANQHNLTTLNERHSKLSKKCFYLRNRIEYLLNELHSSSGRSGKNLIERLSVWKKFIENNEYILNQRLTREERETLYSFLRGKLLDADPDIREAEDLIFG